MMSYPDRSPTEPLQKIADRMALNDLTSKPEAISKPESRAPQSQKSDGFERAESTPSEKDPVNKLKVKITLPHAKSFSAFSKNEISPLATGKEHGLSSLNDKFRTRVHVMPSISSVDLSNPDELLRFFVQRKIAEERLEQQTKLE